MNKHDHGHEHTAKDEPVTQPTRDEVAKQAYAIYTKEGKPQGHAEQNWLEAEAKLKSGDHMHMDEHGQDHHGHDHHAPMAISATEIFERHPECYEPKTAELFREGRDAFHLPGIHKAEAPISSKVSA